MGYKNHNGYTNRETWLVNLHYGEFFQSFGLAGNDLTADYMESLFEDILTRPEMKLFFCDKIDLGAINWRELEELYISNTE